MRFLLTGFLVGGIGVIKLEAHDSAFFFRTIPADNVFETLVLLAGFFKLAQESVLAGKCLHVSLKIRLFVASRRIDRLPQRGISTVELLDFAIIGGIFHLRTW